MTTDSPSIRLISSNQTRLLRNLVLRPGLPVESCHWPGDDLDSTKHFGLFAEGVLVSIASVYARESTVPLEPGGYAVSWQLRGMATHPDCRGRGYGGLILEHILGCFRNEDGRALIWCNARSGVVGFYGKYGFEVVGSEFEIEGIGPHFVMYRGL